MDHFYGKLTAVILTTAITTLALSDNLSVNPAEVKLEKKEFIQQLVTKDNFSQEKLNYLFQTLHSDPKVISCMTKPFEKQPWSYYRTFFITPERVNLGAQYLKTHHAELIKMQKEYGVPATIITAIIGVETEYGMHLGTYSVLRTLYTLGFYYPPREKFFRNELAQYLILTRNNDLNPTKLKGSYAGALGIPQFMPSSYRSYGVAYEKNSSVNLFKNDDAIISVANYFHKHGWQANQPIANKLYSKHDSLHENTKLLALPLESKTQYWETYKNFNVIMSYNHNIVYAMAVLQLSQAIQKEYDSNLGKKSS